MSKSYGLIGLIGAFILIGLVLFSVPQSASDASNQRAEVTAEGTDSVTPIATPMQVVVEALTANLREKPATESKLLGMVRRGTRLTVIGSAYDSGQIWYLVILEGDEQAWISDAIVHVAGNPQLVPTINLTAFYAPTNTPTPTPTSTNTPTNTPTLTPTFTSTPTDTPTNTATSTNTPTSTPTFTNTPTNTPRPSPTHTSTPTKVPSGTPTKTPHPVTSTPRPSPTSMATSTKVS